MKIKLSKSQWEEMGKKAGWIKKTAAVTVPMGQFGLSIPQSGDARPMGPAESNYTLEFSFKGQEYSLTSASELPLLIKTLVSAFQSEIQSASTSKRR